jgi:hypothetical protein
VGNLDVFSKVEALELSARINQPISWHYNDEIFDQYDWTQEPEQGLSDLYQERARQIRAQYDHVILFYSGGADSHNMLESFLHAGVDIDEIVSFHSFGADGDRTSMFNREIFETAVPFVKKQKNNNRLKSSVPHTLIDMSEIISKFYADINWLDFPYMFNSTVSINNVARAYLRKYVTEWANLIDQGKKLVLVWGHDKPRILHEDNRFYLNFMDMFDNCISTWTQQNQPAGWFDEMFYSTPDLPELIIKQAHVTKNFLNNCPDTHSYLTTNVSGLGHVVKHKPDGSWQSHWLTQDAQSLLIYPWFDPFLYYDKKASDVIFSPRDTWFWKDTVLSSRYHTTVQGLISKFGDLWLNQIPERKIRATRNFRSKKYWLSREVDH